MGCEPSELWRRAPRVIPGGVNSPVRAMQGVGLDEPIFMRAARAPMSRTSPAVGTSTGCSRGGRSSSGPPTRDARGRRGGDASGDDVRAPTEAEVELAEEIVDAVPSIEMVRMVSSGTEAVDERDPPRARRHPPRPDHQVRRCYHGHVDALLASAGSGIMTLGIPSTPGVPARHRRHDRRRFNDVDGVAAPCERYGEGLAAIIVEPVAGNMGCVPPAPGFLEALRALANATGALLVFDEVMTGFRVARGGAQELYGITPDLTVLGKIVGGGLPAAAFGGRADLMEHSPRRHVYQAGTLSGNPLATAAGVSVLRRLRDPAVYEQLEAGAARLEQGLSAFGHVQRVGAMLTLFCGEAPVRDYEDASRCDTARFGALFRHLLAQGDLPPAVPVRVPLRLDRARRHRGRCDGRGGGAGLRAMTGSVFEVIAAGASEETCSGRVAPPGGRAWTRRSSRPRPGAGAGTRPRDDLRGLSPPLRAVPALRAARPDIALLLGDSLLAHGLVRIAATGRRRRGG